MKGSSTAVLCKDRPRYSDLGVTLLYKFSLQRAWLRMKWYLYRVIPCSAIGRAGDRKQPAETLYSGTLCSGLMRNRMPSAGSSRKQEFQKNIYFCCVDYVKAFDCVDHNKQWKILKKMGIPDHLTCLLRNLYARQEVTVRTGYGTTDWFQKGNEYIKVAYCHPAYLTYVQSTS